MTAQAILKASKASMGMDTSEQDMYNILIFTERMISLATYKRDVSVTTYSHFLSYSYSYSYQLIYMIKWKLLLLISAP